VHAFMLTVLQDLRAPRCERGYNSNKARRCNHLALLDRL